MLEILGISGKGYKFRFMKISAYIDPFDHSKQIRLLIKVIFVTNKENLSNPLYIYFQSDKEIEIKDEVFDKSKSVIDERYLKRIGADKKYLKRTNKDEKEEIKIPFEIIEINSMKGEDNKIRVEIVPNNEKMSKNLENVEEDAVIGSGFMVDIIVQNEGIETEPYWRRLSGWSRFAWRFHFKVWSITEDMEPVKAIFPKMGQRDTSEIYFTNPTDEVQVFLIIPKSLVESYGQVVTHPGGDTVHIMTERDKNTFLISEENREKDKEEIQDRIRKWTEEGAMVISWSYSQTGSMSREIIVEHRRAHPRFWAFLTFAALTLILGTNISPRIFPFSIADRVHYFWEICLILFVFSYFYTNLYNFSFYELKKKIRLRYLVVFLRIPIISIIVVFTILSKISIPEIDSGRSILLILIAVIALVFGSALTYLIENEKIKRGDIRIREFEKASYMLIKILTKIIAISFVSYLAILAFDPGWEYFPILFACVYAITVILETSEGKAIKWLQP